MADTPDLAAIAALVGDATRARMLAALMDGRAHTATELALESGVAPSTASSHLARLVNGGLVTLARQSRHRYFRVATRDVATALETLMNLAPGRATTTSRPGPGDPGLRRARVCYDHLAGEAGVHLLDRLKGRRLVRERDGELLLTRAGEDWCRRMGLDVAGLRRRRRPMCRPCLDWSERRMHLGGALGASLLEFLFVRRLARREPDSRAVTLSPRGLRFVDTLEAPSP
jgi:DNA-binding transcriptional ArsR family regulator